MYSGCQQICSGPMDSRRSAASLWKALHVGCGNPGYSCMRGEMSINKERWVWIFASNMILWAHDLTFPCSCLFCTELRATQWSPELKPLQQKGSCLFARCSFAFLPCVAFDLTHSGTCYGQKIPIIPINSGLIITAMHGYTILPQKRNNSDYVICLFYVYSYVCVYIYMPSSNET